VEYRTTIKGVAVVIDLPGVTQAAFDAVGDYLDMALRRPEVRNRDAIKDAYLTILRASPTANASDLWHHVVYRRYCEVLPRHRLEDPRNSWVRASGEALELALEEWYTPVLEPHQITIKALVGRPTKLAALTAMNIHQAVGADKLDMALYLSESAQIFGGVHVKASLAERVSDDVPCSRAMMEKGFFSPLWTLDVKSFPPPKGSLINKGELGTPEKPSAKRGYVEQHGDFDNLYSANTRSAPSLATTHSGKRVLAINLGLQPDLFAQEVIARAERRRTEGRAASPPPPR